MNQEEKLLINKIYQNACYIKYSIISLIISIISMFGLVVADFIGAQSNYANQANNIFLKCIFAFLILDIISLIIFAINFSKFKIFILKNERWNDLLNKLSQSNIESEESLRNLNVDFKSEISGYLLGDLLTGCNELKDLGNLIKTANAGYLFYLLISMSNKVINFVK